MSRTPPPNHRKNPTLGNKPKSELLRAKKSNNFINYMVRQISNKKIQQKNIVPEKNKPNVLLDSSTKNDLNEKLPREKENFDQLQGGYQQCIIDKNRDNLMIDKTVISSHVVDDINYLVKKISLSFNEKKQESSFFISEGIFENAHFKLHYNKNNLDITMLHAQKQAADLMYDNQAYLAAKLATKEINLRRLVFG